MSTYIIIETMYSVNQNELYFETKKVGRNWLQQMEIRLSCTSRENSLMPICSVCLWGGCNCWTCSSQKGLASRAETRLATEIEKRERERVAVSLGEISDKTEQIKIRTSSPALAGFRKAVETRNAKRGHFKMIGKKKDLACSRADIHRDLQLFFAGLEYLQETM